MAFLLNSLRKYRQWRSVQSIMGATQKVCNGSCMVLM
jgi:hypothetical protein